MYLNAEAESSEIGILIYATQLNSSNFYEVPAPDSVGNIFLPSASLLCNEEAEITNQDRQCLEGECGERKVL